MKLTIIAKIRETCIRFLQPTRSDCKVPSVNMMLNESANRRAFSIFVVIQSS